MLAGRGLDGVKMADAHGVSKRSSPRCSAPLTALWRALHEEISGIGENGRGGVCSAFIATAFAQDDAQVAKAQSKKSLRGENFRLHVLTSPEK
jgi:hypothetical protein